MLGAELLRLEESRGPDASPSGGPQTHYVRCVPPGRPTRLAMPNSFEFGPRALRMGQRPSAQARRFYEPQKHSIFLSDSSSAPPRAANASLSPRTAIPVGIALFAFGLSGSPPTGKQPNLQKCNCLSGLKPAGPKTSIASCGPPRSEASARATLRVAEAQPKARPKSQIQPTDPFSAQRGGKTVTGFPSRKTGTAQSPAQFSAPCPHHCGSAVDPPRFTVARWDFISILLSQNEQNPLLSGRATDYLRCSFFARLGEIFSKRTSAF